jgi:hypothetical protein
LMTSVIEWNLAGFGRMAMLMDIGLMLNRKNGIIDWKYIRSRLRKSGLHASFYLTLKRAAGLLSLPLAGIELDRPGRIRSKIFSLVWPPEKTTYLKPKTERMLLKFYLFECGSIIKRVILVKHLLMSYITGNRNQIQHRQLTADE